jgi:hypothetical protein
MKRLLPALALVAVVVAFYSVWRSAPPTTAAARTTAPPSSPEFNGHSTKALPPASIPEPTPTNELASAEAAPALVQPAAAPSSAPPPSRVDPLPNELATLPPETAVENMRSVFRNYASILAGNPVGTNPEITQALQGENPKHINFLKEDGNRVNSQGELVDSWGTPYFFHQLSASQMEIRSAGPDRILYTSDDLVIK